MIPVLETTRLLLRHFLASDAKDVARMAGAEEIYKTTLVVPHPYHDSMASEWIEKHEEDLALRNLHNWAIVIKETGKLAGCISLGVAPKRHLAEVGYWLGVDYWHLGYTTEAAKRVVRFGFENLQLNRVYGRCFSNNPASGKVMEHCGMTFEGVLKSDQFKDGVYIDVNYYGLLREEWLKEKEEVLEPNRVALDIPMGFAVAFNDFYDLSLRPETQNFFKEDLLQIFRLGVGEGDWAIPKEKRTVLDLGWYPEGVLDGCYKLTLSEVDVAEGRFEPLMNFESRSRFLVKETLERWMSELSQVAF